MLTIVSIVTLTSCFCLFDTIRWSYRSFLQHAPMEIQKVRTISYPLYTLSRQCDDTPTSERHSSTWIYNVDSVYNQVSALSDYLAILYLIASPFLALNCWANVMCFRYIFAPLQHYVPPFIWRRLERTGGQTALSVAIRWNKSVQTLGMVDRRLLVEMIVSWFSCPYTILTRPLDQFNVLRHNVLGMQYKSASAQQHTSLAWAFFTMMIYLFTLFEPS